MLHHLALWSDGIHVIHNWEVADAAARVALAVTADDIGKVCKQTDTKKFYVLEDTTPVWGLLAPLTAADLLLVHKTCIPIACGDETTAITAGTKVTFRMPFGMTLSAIKASLTTAQATGGTLFRVDVKKAGVSVFSTKPTLDNTEKTTATAATPSVLSTTALADDDEMTIIVDAIGDGTAKGLKVYLIGQVT